ncbi:MAG: hypothetical protein AB9Q21_10540 [Candidatus Reddybacter sp.]
MRIVIAETYHQVEKVEAVIDSICIDPQWDVVRVILLLVLREDQSLDDELIKTLRSTIRANTTPRHVPAKVIQVADIPRTISGKIVELAVHKVVHGEVVKNTDTLANPEVLAFFANLVELASQQ